MNEKPICAECRDGAKELPLYSILKRGEKGGRALCRDCANAVLTAQGDDPIPGRTA